MSSLFTLISRSCLSALALMAVFSCANANMAVPIEDNALNNQSTNTPKESQIKEKGKVYRDPYGNRISAPHQSHSEKDNEANLEDHIRPTSSLSLKKADVATLATKPNIAVVYFSSPEDINSTDVDVLSGASLVKDSDYGQIGTVAYLANLINEQVHGKLFAIKRLEDYPKEHDDLVFIAANELDNKARPPLKIDPNFDPSSFDIIFLGYPIWWYDLPMSLYSFFDKYDLSGKTIIPFCTHGGNRPYKTFALIAHNEPNAQVTINSGLIINRYDVPQQGKSLVTKWLKGLPENLGIFKQDVLP